MDVPVSTFRAQLKHWIERVGEGTELIITERGVPVARLTGVEGADLIASLERDGLLALVHHETASALMRALWDRADGVIASRLADAEVRAVLRAGERAGRINTDVANEGVARWRELWPALRKVEVTAAITERAADLAEEHGLRAGDGIQLASVELLRPANPVVALTDARLAGEATGLGLQELPRP